MSSIMVQKQLVCSQYFYKVKKYNMFKIPYLIRSFALCFLLCTTTGIFAQEGIEFYHGAWKEAVEMAKKENKIIFVDAFAKWCGPCKRMASTVFTDAKVGEFFNSNFVNMKLDMEEEEGFEFRDLFPVSAFPTLFFIDPAKGEVVQKQVGALDADGFLKLARNVLGKVDNSAEFAKRLPAHPAGYDHDA
jgi:thiol-disulfide isomerase/thioredoxin